MGIPITNSNNKNINTDVTYSHPLSLPSPFNPLSLPISFLFPHHITHHISHFSFFDSYLSQGGGEFGACMNFFPKNVDRHLYVLCGFGFQFTRVTRQLQPKKTNSNVANVKVISYFRSVKSTFKLIST